MSGVLLLVGLLALGLSALLTWRFSRPNSRFYILDHPNERSLHTRPTPRTGGIAIIFTCLLMGTVLAVYSGQESPRLAWLAAGAIVLAATSFIDDRFRLTARRRLAVHVIVAAALIYGEFVLNEIELPGLAWTLPAIVALPITLLYIIWMINLNNFMDGMDGFAGGMAVFGFSVYIILGWSAGQWLFAGLNLAVAAAAAGFLLFNFPPARIFMGDTGSSSLGLFAAAFSIWGAQTDVFPFWVSLLVFSPFIVDATVTLCRRIARGEKPWQAHRTHYYQRLVRLGWGHRRTVLWEYSVMVACAVSALIASRASLTVQWLVIGFWIVAYVLMALTVRHLERVENAHRIESLTK